MDSPLAPKPINPGLMTHRVARGGRDRKGKGRSFEEELTAEHEGEEERPAPEGPAVSLPSEGGRPAPPPDGSTGRILDIEA